MIEVRFTGGPAHGVCLHEAVDLSHGPSHRTASPYAPPRNKSGHGEYNLVRCDLEPVDGESAWLEYKWRAWT